MPRTDALRDDPETVVAPDPASLIAVGGWFVLAGLALCALVGFALHCPLFRTLAAALSELGGTP